MDTALLIDFAVSIVITTLRGLKGPKKKAQFKKVFLKVHTLIKGVYSDDPDFGFVEAEPETTATISRRRKQLKG
jgi:hypothetical protein